MGCGITPPRKMASEIATIRFVKKNTKIPVPEVLAYDPDEDGKVGGEWMLMEYIKGVNVQKAWQNMDEDQRALVVRAIADVWAELLGLRFSSIGSIWEDGENGFKVGPMTFMPTGKVAAIAPPDPKKCGPFESPLEWIQAVARRDLAYQCSPEEDETERQLRTVAVVEQIASDRIVPEQPDDDMTRIALEHGDMNYSNILLDETNPTVIKAVIDWEGARTVPLWAIQLRPFGRFREDVMSEKDIQRYQLLFRSYVGEKVPAWLAATGDPGKHLRRCLTIAEWSDRVDPLEFFETVDKWHQGLNEI
ncbi:hypothetical protein OE88DRAFT_477089 [Heliocybe sulcata]|uniref:Aminoglycoside phosphotransferase domain-containing protein n=1 Tax=Heliocybe sulcata TaxID=5364 RepID=A0A5C3MW99_9AGAM|nr:hypothetical protein OE88DRAFT_477089 [Heliocybe sulcata]